MAALEPFTQMGEIAFIEQTRYDGGPDLIRHGRGLEQFQWKEWCMLAVKQLKIRENCPAYLGRMQRKD